MTVTKAMERLYFEGRANGLSMNKAARGAGFSESTAKRLETGSPDAGKYRLAARNSREMPDPMRRKDLCPEAKRALNDFGYFQQRYLGRIPVYWQVQAAKKIVELLNTTDKEYAVINAPPGSGKSTLFTHDVACWIICQRRDVRLLIGSATSKLAGTYVARLRRTLESVIPIVAEDGDRENGTAVDAVTTVSADFGRFKPTDHETWTKEAFLVEQYDGLSITEKEPTVTGVGRDQEFIGGRYDICIWDDLVTTNRLRSMEMIEKDRDWWDTYAERRLEPGGLLLLQGQRMGAEDLYHYCLDMEVVGGEDNQPEFDEDIEESHVANDRGTDTPRKYHHIIFKAHYGELCTGKHRRDAKPYPQSCLLYPARLPWRDISPIMHNRPEVFATVYQQEDVAASEVLVNPIWVSGNGKEFPGCWDKDRNRLEVPQGLIGGMGGFWSVMSCDPSPSRFWGIQWWLFHPESNQRFLLDLERRGMDADDFLDWNYNEGRFTGLLHEWWETSRSLGVTITHVIVEVNAAQRFLLQYDHVRRWMAMTGVEIVAHSTHRNKSDSEYGIQTLGPHWKYGRVRLPGKGEGRLCSLKLVEEVTKYPKGGTDDQVLAEWFTEWQFPILWQPEASSDSAGWRPSWLKASEVVPA